MQYTLISLHDAFCKIICYYCIRIVFHSEILISRTILLSSEVELAEKSLIFIRLMIMKQKWKKNDNNL